MFRSMPATRRTRLRWFSASLKARSQTSSAVSAASIDASASSPRPQAATAHRRRQSAEVGRRRRRLRLSLPRAAGALRRTGSRGRAISPRRGSPRRAAARSDRPAGCNQDPRSRSVRPRGKARAAPARCGGAPLLFASSSIRRAASLSRVLRQCSTRPDHSCIRAGEPGRAQTSFQSSRQRSLGFV